MKPSESDQPGLPGQSPRAAASGVGATDSLSHYLGQIVDFELLSAEDELSHTAEMHRGFETAGQALALFPPAWKSLLRRFDHWLRYSRRSASLLRNVSRPPIPDTVVARFESLALQSERFESLTRLHGVGGAQSERQRQRVAKSFRTFKLAWPTLRAMTDESCDLFDAVAASKR